MRVIFGSHSGRVIFGGRSERGRRGERSRPRRSRRARAFATAAALAAVVVTAGCAGLGGTAGGQDPGTASTSAAAGSTAAGSPGAGSTAAGQSAAAAAKPTTATTAQAGTRQRASASASASASAATPSSTDSAAPGTPPPSGAADQRLVTFVNRMDETIWVAAAPSATSPLAATGWVLSAGQSVTITTPNNLNTRFWGRTGCVFNSAGVGHCQTGDCGGLFQCKGWGTIPATLAEVNFDAWDNLDFYDVSMVDGSTIRS
jgi:hypothetical protein